MLSDAEEGMQERMHGRGFPAFSFPANGRYGLVSFHEAAGCSCSGIRKTWAHLSTVALGLPFSLARACSAATTPAVCSEGIEVSMTGTQESFSYEGWLAGPELTSRTFFPLAPQTGEILPTQTQLEGSPLLHV